MRHLSSFLFAVLLVASVPALATDAETLPGQEQARPQASSQCLKDLQAFQLELEDAGFGVLAPVGHATSAEDYGYGTPSPRQRIRTLNGAANLYAQNGDEKSCQMVLRSMRQIYDRHQKSADMGTDDPGVRRAWRRAHLARAEPVEKMTRLMRADILIGADIRNGRDEKLGAIEDLVLDPVHHDIAYVIAARGGFLGFGRKLVAIRWSDLRATPDHEIFVLDVTPSVFEKAPTVTGKNFASTASDAWRRELDRFWGANLKR